MKNSLARFQEFRIKMNQKILNSGNVNIKRFFALDETVYKDGALSAKTKELMGLTSSLVLRCNDCVTYHLHQCAKAGVKDEEFFEAFAICLLVGGSVVIPHLRQAFATLDEIRESS